MVKNNKLRIGISQCLLGDPVRYDGGHKRDALLADTLSQHVEWVPLCPEVEAGLGVPREPMRLEGPPHAPHLVVITSGVDHTVAMQQFSAHRLRELERLDLSGFVFKARSPSCGIGRVPLVSAQGVETPEGVGLFAQALIKHSPLLPVEDEDRLHDPQILKDFLKRVSDYRRSRDHV
ncbi:MAG: DUF523 domain-containing protein [Nitrospiraceae bacterium]